MSLLKVRSNVRSAVVAFGRRLAANGLLSRNPNNRSTQKLLQARGRFSVGVKQRGQRGQVDGAGGQTLLSSLSWRTQRLTAEGHVTRAEQVSRWNPAAKAELQWGRNVLPPPLSSSPGLLPLCGAGPLGPGAESVITVRRSSERLLVQMEKNLFQPSLKLEQKHV